MQLHKLLATAPCVAVGSHPAAGSFDLIDLKEDEEIFSEEGKTLALERGTGSARLLLDGKIDEVGIWARAWTSTRR